MSAIRALSLLDCEADTAWLVETYGFRNRWTAKIYQWFLAFSEGSTVACDPTPENLESLADEVREWVTSYKKVPESRLYGVDFHHIALTLCGEEV